MNKRGITAIAKKAFRNSGGLKSNVSGITLAIGIVFTIAFISAIVSLFMPWREYFYHGDEAYDIVFVHTPDSLRRYINENRPEVSMYESKKYDVSAYDFVEFGKIMHEKDAFLLIYFPEDFDERIYSGSEDAPEVLTYYRTDSVLYAEWKKYVVDDYMSDYLNFINAEIGKPAVEITEVNISKYPVQTAPETDGWTNATRYAANSVIPLILFIGILYMSMNSGTNVIAGEKEKGTFAAVLLSPIPRKDIIIGNLIGVSMAAAIPAVIFFLICCLVPFYTGVYGFIIGLPLLLSLVIFIAAATLLISVMNDSIVSAQTAYLPLFFILVTICITCIQNVDQAESVYKWVPIYGHFYGLGSILTNCDIYDILNATICTISTLILSGVICIVSVKLLSLEAFTVYTDADSDKKDRRFLTDPAYRKSLPEFLIDRITYPLVILSVAQILAIIPTIIKYSGDSRYAEFIAGLRDVKSIPEIISVSFEVISIFLSDPLFLALMGLGYLLIITCYVLKTRKDMPVGKSRDLKTCMTTVGLTLQKSSLTKYLGGLVLGTALMSAVCLVLKITGQLRFEGLALTGGSIPLVLVSILMWIPQGACEEVMFRGYMIPDLKKRVGFTWSMLLSSILFSVFHSMNVGYTPLASVNLFLIALLFAMISYKSGSIWITCGAHTAWNFCQGNLYGLQVSGSELNGAILKTSYLSGAKDIITGGSFGPEGGLAVTAIIVPILIVMTVIVIKDRKKGHPLWS